MGEDAVFVERVVGHEDLVEEIAGEDGLLLAVAAGEVGHLRRERPPRAVLVKSVEEGVFFDLFEHELAAEALGDHPRHRRLAGSNDALDDDVGERLRKQDRRGGHGGQGATRRRWGVRWRPASSGQARRSSATVVSNGAGT